MVRALGGSGTMGSEGRRHPRVCSQPPATTGRVVNGAAHERMAKREAPWHLGWAHEVEGKQVVQRIEAVGFGQACCGGGEVGLKRLARHGRTVEQCPRL